ncbi:aquaporin [Nakamurella flavida]|uniref:Aquaporin n=1 Tax=Nakamurella flavida TaxID=363630 RepID=A0A939C598_9ACTN|nr:aquaporin [Nakamurella flavida]MBM9475982.1 aquaporin [Nakamurella flavida]MBM9478358.1 aquaporin [Nakamurella flavida]MDP9777729.1 aquaporin Z [Nakamurella flavida]
MSTLVRKAVAELIGTAMLVFFAVGSAVFGIDKIGPVGVALAFGLVLLALAYSLGPVSGCHVNPAVTLGVLLRKGITATEAGVYWASQLVGGIIGAALIQLMLSAGGVTDQTGAKGTNNWGEGINATGAFIIEVLLTFLLVIVVLLTTAQAATPGFAGLAIGLVLTVIHLVGIPLDGTSVNPARSIGPALFEGGSALSHVWLFILGPLVGGALAALAAPLLAAPAVEAGRGGFERDNTDASPDRRGSSSRTAPKSRKR